MDGGLKPRPHATEATCHRGSVSRTAQAPQPEPLRARRGGEGGAELGSRAPGPSAAHTVLAMGSEVEKVLSVPTSVK